MSSRIVLFFILLPLLLLQLNLDPALAKSEYTVQKGDTLYNIALRNNTSVDKLKNLNNLSNNNLQIGQKLKLDSDSRTETGNTITYKVVSGDTLSEIADRYGMSSRDLLKINDLESAKLSIGQEIKIPAGQKEQNVSQKTQTVSTSETANQRIVAQYIVKKGDTLYKIAQVFEVSVDSLKLANNLENNSLKPGGKLLIPSSEPNSYRNSVENNTTYKVQSGDTLSQIAEKFSVSTARLQLYNNIADENLRIGQELRIPDSYTAVSNQNQNQNSTDKPVTVTEKQESNTYKVASGDTLSQIAEKFNISTSSLREVNNLSGNSIRAGQELLIPGKSEVTKEVSVQETIVSEKSEQTDAHEPKETEPEKLSYYTIQKGDTLSEIAEKHNISTAKLSSINNIDSSSIIAGKKIKVPSVSSENSTTPSGESFSYKVRKGDTLYSIARKYGTRVDYIKDINGIHSSNLSIGQDLVIPGDGYVKSSNNTGQPVVYKIQNGDTLGIIARKYGLSVNSIKQMNNLRGNSIIAGDTLLLPSGSVRSVDYRVQRGDNLSSIARNHGSNIELIKKANRLDKTSIYAGQVLSVPVVRQGSIPDNINTRNYATTSGSTQDTNIKNKIISVAKKYLGAPYKFGGTSTRTGIDCSAYVNKVFSNFNVELPRTARDIYKEGQWVDKDELEKGDLVFFTTYAKYPSHVGIYLGDNKFIHASSASKKVTITDINRRYYRKRYIGAKRITVKGLFYEQYSKEFNDTDKNYN